MSKKAPDNNKILLVCERYSTSTNDYIELKTVAEIIKQTSSNTVIPRLVDLQKPTADRSVTTTAEQ